MLADQDYSALKFEEYVTIIEAALREHSLEEMRGTISSQRSSAFCLS